jgi:hypothetical protein
MDASIAQPLGREETTCRAKYGPFPAVFSVTNGAALPKNR